MFIVALPAGLLGGDDLTFALLIFGLPVSYASLLVGLPMFIFFRRRGWLKLWQIAIGGIVCALPFLIGWFWGDWGSLRYASGLFVAGCALVVGPLIAVTFTLLAGEFDGPIERS
jgi:hypothetical protein